MASFCAPSLNCIICFDEFDTSDKVPVVLPCGHTFVCRECSLRLNRCMECREPLYYLKAAAAAAPPLQPSLRASRYVRAQQQQQLQPQKQQLERIRLPVPKNSVLMSIMESAQHKQGDNEDTTFTACDTSGTYAVKEPSGLDFFRDTDSADPERVQQGQLLQIVDRTDEHVYRLARNQGYVLASENQLVKGKFLLQTRALSLGALYGK